MANRPKITICLAAFNGDAYIVKQIQSVLDQLNLNDEVVIVDDDSRDETPQIVVGVSNPQVRLIQHQSNLGVIKTFEHALQEASGDIIFLCDQDDIWLHDKVKTVMRIFNTDPKVTLVLTNGEFMDAVGNPLGRALHPQNRVLLGLIPNLIKNRYQGCAIAFRRELLDAILPFPDGIPMHDSWIGLVNAIVGRPAYLPDKLILYRQHEKSVTKRTHGPVQRMLAQRWNLIINLLRRMPTLIRVRKQLRNRTRETGSFAESMN